MKRSIVYYGDPLLRKKCEEVGEIDDSVRELVDDLLEGVAHYDGVGMAASQLGDLRRVYVVRLIVDVIDDKPVWGEPRVLINPVLSNPSERKEFFPQGCLSIPETYADVERPYEITVEWMDLEGKNHKEVFSAYNATIIMHEQDHLNGVLFIDRLPPEERKRLEPQLRKVKKKYGARTKK